MKTSEIIRRLTLLVWLVCFHLTAIQAQSFHRHEVRIGFGYFGPDEVFDFPTKMMEDMLQEGPWLREKIQGKGIYTLTYRKNNRSEWLEYGFAIGFEQNTSNIIYNGLNAGSLDRTFYTISVEGAYRYVNNNNVQVYSGVGVAYQWVNESFRPEYPGLKAGNDSFGAFSFHLTVAGLRFGRDLGFFTEFGFGYKGAARVGISYLWR